MPSIVASTDGIALRVHPSGMVREHGFGPWSRGHGIVSGPSLGSLPKHAAGNRQAAIGAW
jgi:hypothetical protein